MKNDMVENLVEFEQVSKRYRLGSLGSLRGTVSALLSRSTDDTDGKRQLWAVKDVSFQVSKGESLGIIGPNGAGKTTILKLLSGVTRPSSGRLAVHGRLSCLIELGAGFHPELTGRENIFLNGAILGLSRDEINRKLDAIIAFSELERFLDTPVKRYSSGMYVRLGFAVAAHAEPEVLLVDEVLAVGDASFRHRCMQRMRELQDQGTTIVFVSHNMHQVRDMCDTVLLLANGTVRSRGEPDEIIAEYERLAIASYSNQESNAPGQEAEFSSGGALILKAVEVRPLEPTPEHPGQLAGERPAQLRIHYQAARPLAIGRVDVRVIRDDGTLCSAIDSTSSPDRAFHLRSLGAEGTISIDYNPLQLGTGTYHVLVRVTDESDAMVIASGQSNSFSVVDRYSAPGPGVYSPLVQWAHSDGEPTQES